ncbi:MAG TPA: imelysin family protein [Chitinophagaceae bacterium]|nr:imelysin family protein [Chitinophagaceae bacterium]
MRKKFFLSLLAVPVLLFSCNKSTDNNTNNPPGTAGFDKTAMLTYYADEMVIPAYTAMQQKLTALQTATDAFVTAPSVSSQASLKTAYTEAHLQYERIACFQFGPAETALLDIFMNFSGSLDYNFNTDGELTGFSVDTTAIKNNIETGSYNFTSLTRSSFYTQGFPALNYLLFGSDAVSKMEAKRAAYINAVLARMKSLVDKVSGEWSGYRSTFIGNTQTNVGSPIGNIVNQLAYHMDLMKGPRIGWPFGKQSGGKVFATKCEAYYAGISAALAVENLISLKKLYNGNASGKGISDYLIALNQASLNTDVLAQFDVAITTLKAIPDPMSDAFTAQASKIDAAYKEVQKLLTLLKTDVASATAVQINFMDNDGD